MKTENTIENRVKFGMLYYGQQVVKVTKGNYNFPTGSIIEVDSNYESHVRLEGIRSQKRTVLELTPLSQISDEHAKLLGYGYADHLKSNISREIDNLRLLGYACDWASLTVENQVQYGWVQLKES